MLLFGILPTICGISTHPDYPPGSFDQQSVSNMAFFMVLFMLCTVEVVIIKIIVFDQQLEDYRVANNLRRSTSLWFDEDQI